MSYSSEVLADSPSAYYRLNETSGASADDSSGNGRGLTADVAPTWGAASLLASTSDTAAAFTPSLPAQGLKRAAEAWQIQPSYTVEAWIKTTAVGGVAVSIDDVSAGFGDSRRRFLFGVASNATVGHPDGTLFMWVYTSSASIKVVSPATVNDGLPHHVAAVVNDTAKTVTLYVDGSSVASTSYTGVLAGAQAAPFTIGTAWNASYTNPFMAFSGQIDEVAFYGAALSGTRIAAHRSAGVSTALTGSGASTAPTAASSGSGSVATGPVTGSGASTAPAATSSGAGTSSASSVTGSGASTAPPATSYGYAAGMGVLDLRADVATDAAVTSIESQVAAPEVLVLAADMDVDAATRLLLTPTAPPVTVTQRPIRRHAHIMPALSATNQRPQGIRDYTGTDPGYYPILRDGPQWREHVWVGGRDVTFLRGAPVAFQDYTSTTPRSAESATINVPALTPWDVPGSGDLAMFAKDAPVEIGLVNDTTGEVLPRWEGFFARHVDSSSEQSESYTFHAEGVLMQAAHQLHDPPVFLDATDIGTLVADALNGVIHRRWVKIPRVTTGILSSYRGEQSQTVWQYVQDLLSTAYTDDGRQWTIARVAPYTYRIQLKAALSTVHWTFTKGAPGVSASLTRDESVRLDAIYGRGFGPDGGYWCGRVFPGLKSDAPPRYPMASASTNISVGTTDAMTVTRKGVTIWQRRMRDLGFPVRIDGVMNSSDTKWVLAIQRLRGLTRDGSLGPQTWAATFEDNKTDADTTSYRLPLATLTEVEPWLYSASGARVVRNPADNKAIVRHAGTEIAFPNGMTKAQARPLAKIMLDQMSDPGWQGTLEVTTDPHEAEATRFHINEGDNVRLRGHLSDAGIVLQVSRVSVSGDTVTLDVDTKARDALNLAAIRDRDMTAIRDASGRKGRTDRSALNASQLTQYEAESDAGWVSRTAVNGDSGLWTVRKTFVSQVGVAKVRFTATEPKAEFVIALFNRPIRISTLASLVPDPLASSGDWYDEFDTLRDKYGMMAVIGDAANPCGYFPRQKGEGPLTGRHEDEAGLPYTSPFGGFVWVAMFASRSCWIEGRVFPAVPTT